MKIRNYSVLGFALVAVTTLSGCQSSPSPAGPDQNSGGTASGHSDTACLSESEWSLDINDMAQQILAQLQASGNPTDSAVASGSQKIFFNQAGTMGSTTDLTYTFHSTLSNGLDMTMIETQSGPANSDWAWIDDTNVVDFEDWVSNVQITTSFEIGGKSASSGITLPTGGTDGANMTVLCSANALTTTSEGSPFTMHWSKDG
ncbi:MAG: hypothetical protein KF742_06345 [Cryobacterium sp.]|nr:hypothetical protein [Cryobacterium sp.]MBX3089127.1 hypothetical protein [Cryobacterium sp.]MCO5294337.1 hypothetical protein [Homoserinimonas sp.]